MAEQIKVKVMQGDYLQIAAEEYQTSEDDDIMLINSDGIIIRMKASEVSRLGRATQGVKIMNVGEDANIIALAKVAREDSLDEKERIPDNLTEDEDGQEQMKL